MDDKMKIYYFKSLIDNVSHYAGSFDQVPVYWFAQQRKRPIGIYEDLIVGYNSLSKDEKENAQRWINEGFTEQEIRVVKPIVEQFSYDFELCEISLPAVVKKDGRLCIQSVEEFHRQPWTSFEQFISLDKEKHSLPFDVLGHYTIGEGTLKEEKSITEAI